MEQPKLLEQPKGSDGDSTEPIGTQVLLWGLNGTFELRYPVVVLGDASLEDADARLRN